MLIVGLFLNFDLYYINHVLTLLIGKIWQEKAHPFCPSQRFDSV
jgi:hypothetical protein